MTSLALYIHWPFCASKCPYCDFNSHVRNQIDIDAWRHAYIKELQRHYDLVGKRRISSIFFGGGTPSLMPPTLVQDILNEVSTWWSIDPTIEITLEANPNSVEVNNFRALAAAGINRVSIGIQSLRQDDLTFLGRLHSVEEGIHAIETAQQCFKRISFDLIYARPHQALDAWQAELSQALAFGTEHLSLYQLTIEPGTAFATRHARGDFVLPDEDLAADLYNLTTDLTLSHGLRGYEISNYAQPGCESHHNLAYWRYQDYAGIGPGAHGRLTLNGIGHATKQYRAPETWLRQVVEEGNGFDELSQLSAQEQASEMLLMGLRLTHPFDLNRLPCPIDQVLDMNGIERLVKANLITYDGNKLQVSPHGRLCLNEVLRIIRRPS
ncbi:radical SAM family heme chaperone HemW [Candidatus Odyssella acanthamoebae]|uniref:Heme chaperone HemW n=1 Tax=Candidatus Odyssella acanthamoebae TaxID=91604 RepID=A0A077AZK1_9PROT|nr:radical SAM family heme chaperone HemW [Candidatus Paracaedibacter acanthamoebae]AIK97133.1 coproporphyrinogen III oxidase [Candidatus Paracaedibacter acanthamoebae]